MIYLTRSGIWEVDERGVERLLTETAAVDFDSRFHNSEAARMQSPEKIRRIGRRLLITAIVFMVLTLWSLGLFWEIH
jgi:hypothetical protein